MVRRQNIKDREPFHWRTSISYKTEDKIVIRGYDLNELMRHLTYGEMIYLLLKGELPTMNQGRMIDAIMVGQAEHAFSPSTASARMVASGRPPLPTSIAAGIMAFGEAHGAIQATATVLQDYMHRCQTENKTLHEMAEILVRENKVIPGFHHPQHIHGDPRALPTLALAEELKVAGDYCLFIKAIEGAIESIRGRRIYMNRGAVISAILLDMGFTPLAALAIMTVARAIGCAVHAIEETEKEKAWRASTQVPMVSLLDLSLQLPKYYGGPKDRAFPTART